MGEDIDERTQVQTCEGMKERRHKCIRGQICDGINKRKLKGAKIEIDAGAYLRRDICLTN